MGGRTGRVFGWIVIGVVASVTCARAERVATLTARLEANASGFCLLAPFDDVTFDAFGTAVDFGAGGNTLVCYNFSCQTTPDASLFSFAFGPSDVSGPPVPNQTVPFVVTIHNAGGSLAGTVNADAYTSDGQSTWTGTGTVSQIPGCGISGTFDVYEVRGGVNAFRTAATSTGTNVAVSSTATFTDPNTGTVKSADVGVTFSNVSSAGNTLVTATSSTAGALSSNFSVTAGGLNSVFFDVTTTASFSGPVTICQSYDDANNDGYVDGTQIAETDLRILHGEGNPIIFVDRTTSIDTDKNIICAQVDSLSPFVIAVDVSTTTTSDSVVLPLKPLKATIAKGKTVVTKAIKVKVQNGNLNEAAGHRIRLAVTGSTCPSSLLRDSQNQLVDFDFDTQTAGAQNDSLVSGGGSKTAVLPLRIVAADFLSPNAVSPARCTLTVTASTVVSGSVADPNSSNNTTTMAIDVLDQNDF